MRSLTSAQYALIKDLSPPRSADLPIDIDKGLAYELVLSLRMWVDEEEPSTYEVGPGWFERVQAEAPASLLRDVERFAGGHELLFGHLLGLVRETAAPRDVPVFLSHLGSADALELRRHLLGYHLQTYRGPVPRDVITRAAEGDAVAQRALLSGSDDIHRNAYEHALGLDARKAKELLLSILSRWNRLFVEPESARMAAVLRADADSKRRLLEGLPLDRALELAAPGVRYTPEPGIERVLLVPSWVGRPWVVMCEHDGTKLFCYAATDAADSKGDAPPERLLRLHRALGDESRLRLLRRLSAGSSTLQELADHVGLAKSTVHAHLLALRTSGLAEVRVSDKRYSLRRQAIDDARELLDIYLGEDRR